MVPAVPVDSGGAALRSAERHAASLPMLTLILPAYDEARRLPASLARCAEYFQSRRSAAEIIVADDGSRDDTAAAVAEAIASLPPGSPPVRRLPLAHRGKGGAVRGGVRAATGDPIVVLDADLTIPVDLVGALLAALDAGADIAVASRYMPGSIVDRPWWRRIIGDTYRLAVRTIVPTGVADTQCGGKAYTAAAARDLFARQRLDGFAFDAEVLFLARRSGYRVTEVPLALRQQKATSIDFLADAPGMFLDLLLIRWNGFRGRYDRASPPEAGG